MGFKSGNNIFDDENELLHDMSFTHMDHISPFKSQSSMPLVQSDTLKKSNTVISSSKQPTHQISNKQPTLVNLPDKDIPPKM